MDENARNERYARENVKMDTALQYEYALATARAFTNAGVNLQKHHLCIGEHIAIPYSAYVEYVGFAMHVVYNRHADHTQSYLFNLDCNVSPAQLEKAIGLLLAHNPIEEARKG